MPSYSNANVKVTWTIPIGSILFQGLEQDAFVDLEFDGTEHATVHEGNDGMAWFEVTYSRKGKGTILVAEGSPTNDALSIAYENDMIFKNSVGPMQVLDFSGTTKATADFARIGKMPNLKKGMKMGGNPWQFVYIGLRIFHGSVLAP